MLDEEVKSTMRQTWEENKYQICPHTAVGVAYFYNKLKQKDSLDVGRVVIATASVKKFEEAVVSAGLVPQQYDEVDELFKKPVQYVDMNKGEDWEAMLKQKIVDIDKDRV